MIFLVLQCVSSAEQMGKRGHIDDIDGYVLDPCMLTLVPYGSERFSVGFSFKKNPKKSTPNPL